MAKKMKTAKRRQPGKQAQLNQRGKKSGASAKSADSTRPKRVGSKPPSGSARRARAGPSAAPKPRSETLIQQGRIVIRFRDGFDEEQERKELTKRYGRVVLQPVFLAAHSAIEKLQGRARDQNPQYSLPDFLNYYFLYLPPRSKLAGIALDLRERHTVEFAYEDAPTESANSQPSRQKCTQSSGHIEGLSEGVNARFAWTLPGGKGDGQFLVDVEKGWTKEHCQLPTNRIDLLVGLSQFGERAHGTSVLGIVCGQHTRGGCEGIAPNVVSVGLASTAPDINTQVAQPQFGQDPAIAGWDNLYDAIAIAINELVSRHDASPQDGYGVLLLEHQTSQGLPVETYEGIHALIAFATHEFHITVVEPAGNGGLNGGLDLDNPPYAQLLQPDSGAIMVGSAGMTVIAQPAPDHHKRFGSSNFGNRVNCYAWGERVMTPAWLSGQPNTPGILDRCNDQFGHTSAAAAIIAGVALIVQGLVAHGGRAPLKADQLRAILTNPAYGTPCAAGDRIGVMPDLGKIAPLV